MENFGHSIMPTLSTLGFLIWFKWAMLLTVSKRARLAWGRILALLLYIQMSNLQVYLTPLPVPILPSDLTNHELVDKFLTDTCGRVPSSEKTLAKTEKTFDILLLVSVQHASLIPAI